MFEGEHKVRPYNVVTSTIPFGRNHDQGLFFSTYDIDQMMSSIKSIIATIPYQILDKKEKVYHHSLFYTILRTINEKTQSEVLTNLEKKEGLCQKEK
jgi:hypothetical protein